MDRPEGAPPANHPLLEAARYVNAEAEDHDLNVVFEKRGLTLHDVEYLAYQRAIRARLAMTGRGDEASPTKPESVDLTLDDHAAIQMLIPAYLDGILIGWRGNELSTQETPA